MPWYETDRCAHFAIMAKLLIWLVLVSAIVGRAWAKLAARQGKRRQFGSKADPGPRE